MENAAKRIPVFLLSLVLMAFGVVLSTQAVLGTSPISSVPFVYSLGSGLSLGTATMVFNAFIIIGGAVVMGRDYKLRYLSAVVMVAIFSALCDVFKSLMGFITTDSYVVQWILIVIAAFIVALGVSLEVAANVTMMPGEYFVSFVAFRTHVDFGRVKVLFDVSMITIAAVMSLMYFGGLQGVREGTVFAAVVIGMIVRRINVFYKNVGFFDWIGFSGISARV